MDISRRDFELSFTILYPALKIIKEISTDTIGSMIGKPNSMAARLTMTDREV